MEKEGQPISTVLTYFEGAMERSASPLAGQRTPLPSGLSTCATRSEVAEASSVLRWTKAETGFCPAQAREQPVAQPFSG